MKNIPKNYSAECNNNLNKVTQIYIRKYEMNLRNVSNTMQKSYISLSNGIIRPWWVEQVRKVQRVKLSGMTGTLVGGLSYEIELEDL